MPRETDRLLETPSNNTMSMNVGDSSGLLHGGGGGLSVFWRSRTNFERKLLVVVVVLAVTVLALIITVAVLAANNGSGGLTDAGLRALTEELFGLDVNNVGDQIVLNLQNQSTSGDSAPEPLFNPVPAEALSGPTIAALIALQDNYTADVTQPEEEDASKLFKQKAFLDAVMNTDVMKRTEEFLMQYDLLSMSLREKMEEIWFMMYPRYKSVLGSSGFEHSFVGEIKRKEVIGFHNWVYFYHQEDNGDLDYQGSSKTLDLGEDEVIELHFKWRGYPKKVGGMWVGTSPELDLAVYTVCFLARPSSKCPVQMNAQKYTVQTWTIDYGGHVLVGSAYPII